ncbi:MAG: cytochrome c [Maritimibacter sp.]|nr:cytochrome c [Maritimibacter sp.]
MIAGLALSLVSLGGSGASKQPSGSDIDAGAVLYAENCASCHGENLEGQPDWQLSNDDGTLPAPPHDQTGHTWHHGDALLFDYTKQGGQAAMAVRGVTGFTSGMPAFGETLSDQDIWNILAFIKSTWPDRVRQMQETKTRGEQQQGN